MKKNFKKLMSLALVVVMLGSIFSVSASAATYTITLAGGSRGTGANAVNGYFNEKISAIEGTTYIDENGVKYTINKKRNTISFQTDSSGNFTFPEYFFDMDGYVQYAWVTNKSNNTGAKYKGDTAKVTKNTAYYAGYNVASFTVNFLPGIDGEGESKAITGVVHGDEVTLEGAIFTRPGYAQIGWATTENADSVEYSFSSIYKVTGDINLYPVWQKAIINVTYDVNNISFGSLCKGYITPEARIVTITNMGNAPVSLTLPKSDAYNVVEGGSTTIAANGGTLAVSIQPKVGLDVGSYKENLLFDFGDEKANFNVLVRFVVNDHLFLKYELEGDATYSEDGHKIAKCFNCDAVDRPIAEGSMKKYLAENNTADGLLEEYLYYKTVKFVAFGSGMDDAEGVIGKRFRPTEWSVADTKLGGKFAETYTKTYDAEDYTVQYDHGDGNFGTYTLTIKYVEEEKNADGEWVSTGIEDVKNFKYSIGPSEKDNQEVVRPNMIVSIIFGLFGYLVDLITSGSLF